MFSATKIQINSRRQDYMIAKLEKNLEKGWHRRFIVNRVVVLRDT